MLKKNFHFPRIFFTFILIVLLSVGVTFAQNIPSPEDVIGFMPGTTRKLASYEQAIEYWKALEKATPRMKLFELGKSEMGKPLTYAVISSEENMAKLDHYKEIAKKLARVKGLTDEEAHRLAAEGKSICWIDAGIHAGETAPPQAMIRFAYDLVTGEDKQCQTIRDKVITLLVFPNPDGMTMYSDFYMPIFGTEHEKARMPYLYNKYTGHDDNRDAYMNNMKETKFVTLLVNHEWYPVTFYDHHQSAPFPARIWIPPAAEPTNPNLHPLFIREKNLIGTGMAYEFDRRGMDGTISRCSFDFIYPGYEDSFVDYFNIPSIMSETTGRPIPVENTIDDFPDAFKDFLPSVFYPSPWKPGKWTFEDATLTCNVANLGFLHTNALYAEMFLYNRYKMGKDTIEKFEKEAPYAWIIPKDQWDVPTAANLVDGMRFAGLDVYEAEEAFESDGKSYPAGTWVIPMNQPFSRFIKTCWEKQIYPDLTKYPKQWQGIVRPQVFKDAYLPPYDMAGWTLPHQFGVKVAEAQTPLKAKLKALEKAVPPAGKVEGSGSSYLLCPQANNSYLAVNRILKKGGKVQRALDSFESGGKSYAAGTMIVRSVKQSLMDSLAKELYLNIGKTGKVSVKTSQLKSPRIGHYRGWAGSMDEGWTRWILEQYEFTSTSLFADDVKAGNLRKKYDVLLIPSTGTEAIVAGHKEGTMPDKKYEGGIGEVGVENIKKFVEEGGTLVALRQGCLFAIDKLGLPVVDLLKDVRPQRRRRMGTTSGSPQAAAVKFVAPGSLMKMTHDPKHPVAYGMPEKAAGMFYGSYAFEGGKVVSKYGDKDILLSGYIVGEKYLNNKAAVVEVPLGKGKAILLGFAIQNRAQPQGTFKLLFNSLYYGATK